MTSLFVWLRHVLGVPATIAIATDTQVLVRIGPNPWGGTSLYPVNDYARQLMGGDEATGNFATEADARQRIAWNCWQEAAQ